MFDVAYTVLTVIILVLMAVGLSKALWAAARKSREDLTIDLRE